MALVGIDVARVQRRTLTVLVAGQVFGGAAAAAGITVSALLAKDLLHGETFAGLGFASVTLGSAGAAVPLSRHMARSGRRSGLTLGYRVAACGALLTIAAAELRFVPLLLAGLVLFGAGNASNLLARYAAVDLALPAHRGRAMSTVVFATTLGAVVGPNLIEPAGVLAGRLGLPDLAGPYLVALVLFTVAAAVEAVFLRPDPLVVAGRLQEDEPAIRSSVRRSLGLVLAVPDARLGLASMVVSHGVMVTLMTMTPLHMEGEGETLGAIGAVISIHIAGMYSLSPLVGWLADRVGRLPVASAGAASILVGSVVAAGGHHTWTMAVALFLLGLGWSCGLIAGSAVLTDALPAAERPASQGAADLLMGVTGSVGGVTSGLVVGALGFTALTLTGATIAGALLVLLAGEAFATRRLRPAA